MNGFSVFICFGKWATPTIQFGSFIRLRICLGFVAISFYTTDMENFLTMLMKERHHDTTRARQ